MSLLVSFQIYPGYVFWLLKMRTQKISCSSTFSAVFCSCSCRHFKFSNCLAIGTNAWPIIQLKANYGVFRLKNKWIHFQLHLIVEEAKFGQINFDWRVNQYSTGHECTQTVFIGSLIADLFTRGQITANCHLQLHKHEKAAIWARRRQGVKRLSESIRGREQ